MLVSAGPVTATGGFGYPWGGDLQLWFDDGCVGAMAFKTDASHSSARAAADTQTITVPTGQTQVTFAARSADAASYLLRSPTGQVVDPSQGVQGALDSGGYRIVADDAHHGTDVLVVKPAPGTWTLAAVPGSPAITQVGIALRCRRPRSPRASAAPAAATCCGGARRRSRGRRCASSSRWAAAPRRWPATAPARRRLHRRRRCRWPTAGSACRSEGTALPGPAVRRPARSRVPPPAAPRSARRLGIRLAGTGAVVFWVALPRA